jgi:organic hydroperoxide reductase OsmC/OhrA
MAIRTADAEWHGNLAQDSSRWGVAYHFRSRMGEGNGTNPEELPDAAYAGASRWRWCFS